MMTPVGIEKIARICHEANRAYCASIGDNSQVPWEQASTEQRESATKGVMMHKNNPDAGAEDSHKSWMREKLDNGWVYGATKSEENKTHPCLVLFTDLRFEQQIKDHIFRSVVHAMLAAPQVSEDEICHVPFPNPDKKQDEDVPVSELTSEQRLNSLESSRDILFEHIVKLREHMSDGNCLGDDGARAFLDPDPGDTRPGQFSDFSACLSKGVTSDPEFIDKPLKIHPSLVSTDRELISALKGRIEDQKDHIRTIHTQLDLLHLQTQRMKAKLSFADADERAKKDRGPCSGKGGSDA